MTSKLSRYYKKTFTNIKSSVTFLNWAVFPDIVLGNKDSDLSSFKFLFGLYITLTVSLGKIWSISWLLCNKSKCFLMMVFMLGSNGLYCVITLHEAEKLLLLFLGLIASSLEMFVTSENCVLTLLGFQSLATKYFWYWPLRSSNLSSDSQILLNRNATPLRTFSMLFLGKQALGLGSMYVKVLLTLAKLSSKMFALVIKYKFKI